MSRFDMLVELRKLYEHVAWLDYNGRRFRKVANEFVNKSRELFSDDTLDFKRAADLVFSLEEQDYLIGLDEADNFELPEVSQE